MNQQVQETEDTTTCPKCDAKVSEFNNSLGYWECECGFKFDEGGDEYVPCTHDSFTVWIVETRKQYYERNKFTGQLEETYSKAYESDWSTITCECDECGIDLDQEEINRVHEIEGWKPEKPVWKLRADVTRVTDEIRYAMGKDPCEAKENLKKEDSHLYMEFPYPDRKPKFKIKSVSRYK